MGKLALVADPTQSPIPVVTGGLDRNLPTTFLGHTKSGVLAQTSTENDNARPSGY